DQVPRRVAADGEFGKQDEAGACRPRLLREVDDPGSVAGKISNCGINLSQRDLHTSSVKGRCAGAKSAESGPSVVAGDSPTPKWHEPRGDSRPRLSSRAKVDGSFVPRQTRPANGSWCAATNAGKIVKQSNHPSASWGYSSVGRARRSQRRGRRFEPD
ncbi:MAG: hypothetical protein QOF56_1576, partial [Acidobacteriaceae bacterium]|nr:hypothetical protein [Acidobacteriaceae bacterium]